MAVFLSQRRCISSPPTGLQAIRNFMKTQIRLLTAAIVAAQTFTCAQAEESVQELDSVVVTANRIAAPVMNDAQVLVFDRAAIEQSGVASLADLLVTQAGFEYSRSGGPAHTTNLYIRGLESKQLVFLVNGQRIGSATLGTSEFQLIPVEQIERVEVFKGTRSAIYGADAQGGVVNIITRKNTSGTTALLSTGSDKTTSAALRSQTQIDALGAYLNLSSERSDGYDLEGDTSDDDDGYRRNSLNTGMSYALTDTQSVNLDLQINRGLTEFDNAWSTSDTTDYDNRVYTLGYDYRARDLTIHAQAGRSEDRNWTYDGDASRAAGSDYYGTRKDNAEVTASYWLADQHNLILAIDTQNTELSSRPTTYDKTSASNTGAVAAYRFVTEVFSAEAGTRYDDNSSYGEFWSFNTAATVEFGRFGSLSGGQATGFRAPTFNDLYYPGFSNPDLEPEISRIWSLDYVVEVADSRITVSGQRALFNNQILYNSATFLSENIGRSVINAASIDWTQQWTDTLSTQLIQEWTEATNLTNDQTLPRRPVRATKLNTAKQWNKVTATASVLYRDEAVEYDFLGQANTIAAYTLINLGADYQLSSDLTLAAHVRNLTDRDYESVVGYPAQGRYVEVSGRYSF